MNKFQAHINPTKTIELVRDNGEKDVFTIHPLPFKQLPKVFKLLESFKGFETTDDSKEMELEDFFKTFKPETIGLIQELVLDSLIVSYPDAEVKDLEGFAQSNLFNLLPVVIEVNSFDMKENADG